MNKILFTSAFLCMSLISFGQDLYKFDLNKDSLINEAELKAIYFHLVSPEIYKSNDDDKNGVLDGNEPAKLDAKFISYRNLIIKKVGALPVAVEKLSQRFDDGPKLFGILLRAEHEDITMIKGAEDAGDVEAAVFSYTANRRTDSDGFIAKGAILRPFKIYSHNNTEKKTSFRGMLVPSVTFNRVSDPDDSTNDANSLVGRLGVYHGFTTNSKFSFVSLNLFGSYATDFDFNSEVYATEFDLQFVNFKLFMGAYRNLGDVVRMRLRLTPHLELGETAEKGDKENLEEGEFFFRAGAKTKIQFQPAAEKWQRLELTGAYNIYGGIQGSPDLYEFASGKVSFALDKKKRVSVSAEYNKGKVALTLEEIENVIVGFSAKL